MIRKLPILAIETSQSCCGACIYFDQSKYFEMCVNVKNLHAEKIYEIIDSVIKLSSLALSDLGCIAVSSGPGSFTGLRIGMSAAKGVAFGASIPIIAVPTFEALAFQLSHTLNNGTEFVIANNVNSEEIYFAKFQVKSNSYIFAQELRIVRKTDEILSGSDYLIYGNTQQKNIPIHNTSFPRPEYVAKWAEFYGDDKIVTNYEYLEPFYLKNFIIRERNHD
jgi:tRNA threonylcarbamoyladenosine biosynthesis protein TsaB